ncbi:MAG TPA: hydroxymethylbilane synthase [Caulobacterales bacterium]|jgi:hydroxymethylbilane synthase|nr:hydroxymethylbilane synthase [Caulobacterales bacterium]
MSVIFRIGARGSPLSMTQSRGLQARLGALLGVPAGGLDDRLPITAITTTGDKIQDRPLAESGGKGLFTKELDEALIGGRIDLAVHSAKDLPTRLPDEIALACVPEREDARDAFISLKAKSPGDLAPGATVGSASLRRQAQLLYKRPDLRMAMLRGNVETRLRKIETGEADATFLALAGLKRLGLERHARCLVDIDDMPPAAAQGALAITARIGDARTAAALAPLNDTEAWIAVAAERAFLLELDGSCRTPIAAHAARGAAGWRMIGEVLSTDGRQRVREIRSVGDLPTEHAAAAFGLDVARAIKQAAGAALAAMK